MYSFSCPFRNSLIAFSSAGNFLTTLPRVPSVAAVSQPAGLAPGEESPGVSLLPAVICCCGVFTLVSLIKTLFFRFLQLQAQVCVGTPDHCGSSWGKLSPNTAGAGSGSMGWFRPLELICDSNVDRRSKPELRCNQEPVTDAFGPRLTRCVGLLSRYRTVNKPDV